MASSLPSTGPFLSNESLKGVLAIEIDGIKISALEILEYQTAIGGQLVVGDQLRRSLESTYNNYLVLRGKPPDAIRHGSYPEKLFLIKEMDLTRIVEGGFRPLFVPQARKGLLFFAIPRRFAARH